MENKLPQIKVYDIDYGWIIKNYLNPEMWQKTWTLFVYKKFVITLKLYNIYCKDEKIVFEIQIKDNDENNEYYDYWDNINRDKRKTRSAYYSLKTDNINLLKKEIESKCFDCIMDLEKEAIRNLPGYKSLVKYKQREKEILTNIANEFLDAENVTHKDIREVYIESYLDKCMTTESKKDDFIDSYQGTLFSDLYLIFIKASKNETLQTRFENMVDDSDLLAETEQYIKEYLKYIDSDEYIKDQEDELEDI